MNESVLPKQKSSRGYIFAKIAFFFIAFIFIILTILTNMGGKSDFHRESLEQLATEFTGYPAQIGLLIGMTYFPTISADFEDMEFTRGTESVMHIDKAQFAMSFWDMMFRNGKIKILNIRGFHARADALIRKPVQMEHFGIVEDDQTSARLEGQGYIGSTPFKLSLSMATRGVGKSRKYFFDSQRDIHFELGDIEFHATAQNAHNPYLSFQDIKIARNGKVIVTGQLDIAKRREREITITGNLKIAPGDTVLLPDLLYDRSSGKLSGTIKTENFHAADVTAGSGLDALIRRFVEYLGNPETDSKFLDTFFADQNVMLDTGIARHKLEFLNNTMHLPMKRL